MRNRWLIYVAVGLCFGIADWYFLDLLASLSQNQALNDNLLRAPEIEWIGIAVIGGVIVGALSAYVFRLMLKRSVHGGVFVFQIVFTAQADHQSRIDRDETGCTLR